MARRKKLTLLDDPRYKAFVDRYHPDPLRFAVEVMGFSPSADQEELFHALKPLTAKVSVVSGTGTGKTASFGRIALWHLLCFPIGFCDGQFQIGSNTYIGAPKLGQVSDGVWKEMTDAKMAMANGPYAWLCDYFTINKTRVHVNGFEAGWFISQVAFQKGESVAVAGRHRYYQMIIIDEAAGVGDDHFDVVDGTQTQGGNRTLIASQGVRTAGRFYDSHHSLNRENGGSWHALRFSSERSPFVETRWLKERANESGGRNSEEYRIRCLGLFSSGGSNVLMSRDDVEKVFSAGKIIDDDEPFGLVVLSDVALGEYRDDSVIVLAKILGDTDFGPDARRVEFFEIPLANNDKNEIDLAGDLVNQVGKLSNATLYVDAGGVGNTVCKLIERSGGIVERVNWGSPCFRKEYKERFFNQRACAMVRFRDAVRDGRVSITADISKRLREKIIDQGSRLPYHYSESGTLRYVIQSKKEMLAQGIKSPDLIDAMSFAFLEQCVYTPAEKSSRVRAGTLANKAEAAASELFAEM